MKNIFLLLVLTQSLSLFAQDLNWFHRGTDGSYGQNTSVTSAGDILFVIDKDNESNLAKISGDGDLIWEQVICDFCASKLVISAESDDGSLIHLFANGFILETDSEGNEPTIIEQLTSNTSSSLGVGIAQIQNHELLVLTKGDGQTYYLFRYSLVTKELTSLTFDFDANFRNFDINKQNGNIALLHGVGEYNEILVLDGQGNELNEILIDSLDGRYYHDLVFISENDIVALGYINMYYSTDQPILQSINIDGEQNWKKEYQSNIATIVPSFSTIDLLNGEILLGGGIGLQGYITSIDNKGDIIWEKANSLDSFKTTFRKLILDSENNLIASGTTDFSDIASDWKAIVVKYSNLPTSQSEVYHDELLWFPNPTTNSITLSAITDLNHKTQMYDLHGKLVLLSENSNTIEVSNLSAGIYIVLTEIDGLFYRSKLAVERTK